MQQQQQQQKQEQEQQQPSQSQTQQNSQNSNGFVDAFVYGNVNVDNDLISVNTGLASRQPPNVAAAASLDEHGFPMTTSSNASTTTSVSSYNLNPLPPQTFANNNNNNNNNSNSNSNSNNIHNIDTLLASTDNLCNNNSNNSNNSSGMNNNRNKRNVIDTLLAQTSPPVRATATATATATVSSAIPVATPVSNPDVNVPWATSVEVPTSATSASNSISASTAPRPPAHNPDSFEYDYDDNYNRPMSMSMSMPMSIPANLSSISEQEARDILQKESLARNTRRTQEQQDAELAFALQQQITYEDQLAAGRFHSGRDGRNRSGGRDMGGINISIGTGGGAIPTHFNSLYSPTSSMPTPRSITPRSYASGSGAGGGGGGPSPMAGSGSHHGDTSGVSNWMNPMTDEDYARSMQHREEERMTLQRLHEERTIMERNRRRPSRSRRCVSWILTLLVLLVASYFLVYFFTPYFKTDANPFHFGWGEKNPGGFFGNNNNNNGGGSNGNGNGSDGLDFGDDWDAGEARLWKGSNKRQGLKLPILNACTNDWVDYIEKAVFDWNQSPSLDLTLTKVDPDPICLGQRGTMKVCNSDYGITSWVGVNEVILENGFIVLSTARMNEHYMSSARQEKRQYTMCHEIGHGLGLPHTDENFFNADLGNCLDYTNNPGRNQQPDQMNFNALMKMYGPVPEKVPDTTAAETIDTTTDLWETTDEKVWKHAKNGLSLVIINALTPEWYSFFDKVFADWSQAPALDLVAVSTPADDECKPVFQSMKVCNGDYGDTDWVGINQLVLENDEIIMSTAKMNDYHLINANEQVKHYTMCHEFGHGFGLTHTDEDHFNKNTGNCLDYTDDPEENLASGRVNWMRLEVMYGLPKGEIKERNGKDTEIEAEGKTEIKEEDKESEDVTEEEMDEPFDDDDEEEEEDDDDDDEEDDDEKSKDQEKGGNDKGGKDKNKNRNKDKDDRRFLRPWDKTGSTGLSSMPRVEANKWRMVRQTAFEEVHVAELGEGIQIITQVIYA